MTFVIQWWLKEGFFSGDRIITCTLTADNKVNGVYYKGFKLGLCPIVQCPIQGDMSNWESEKKFSFNTPAKDEHGEIKVEVENYEDGDHCSSAGFIMLCEASDSQGPWHNFKSDTEHWRAEDDSELCVNGNSKYYSDYPNNSFSLIDVPLTYKLKSQMIICYGLFQKNQTQKLD